MAIGSELDCGSEMCIIILSEQMHEYIKLKLLLVLDPQECYSFFCRAYMMLS